MRWHVTSLLICYDDEGEGGTARVGGGAGVILPFAAITTKSIIHLYKLKAKKFAHKRHNLVVKCCHGHCCSPVRGCLLSPSPSAVAFASAAVLVDIFISKLILIDYILCAREEQQQ